MTKRHTVGCSFPPCTYHRRKSWCFTCARHRGEPEKPTPTPPTPSCDDGRAEGRREALWLMAVGAACDEALEGCGDGMSAVLGMAYGNVATYALQALADMGDERAREMLR